jgi:starch phosphorylase
MAAEKILDRFDALKELALDLRWSWNHCTDEVWRQLDPALWELTQNPWVVLQTVSKDKLQKVLADPAFRKNIDDLLRAKRQAAETPAWFQQHHPQAPLTCVAYFSMEFMLSEALPIYSGGWAMWPVINSKPPATWACRWSASGCSTNKAIFAR